MNSGINKRKRLLIHPKFQLAFLGYMLLFSIVITSVMLTSTYYYYQISVAEGLEFGYEKGHIFFEYIGEQYYELNKIVIAAACVTSLVLIFGGLYLSNRIVGPIERFKSELRKLGEYGEFHEVHFRKKDYFKDLADAYNKAMKKFLERSK